MGSRVSFVSDIEILQEMLISNVQVPLEQQGEETYSVKLTDDEAGTTVIVKGIPKNSVVIRADDFFPSACNKNLKRRFIFGGSKGESKRADFVIVSNDTRKWIICIETKESNEGRKEIVKQLKGALCFVKYCKSIGKEFWSRDGFLDNYDYRFISMVEISIDMRSTRSNKPSPPLHSRPEDFLKIFGKTHHFRRLTNRGS